MVGVQVCLSVYLSHTFHTQPTTNWAARNTHDTFAYARVTLIAFTHRTCCVVWWQLYINFIYIRLAHTNSHAHDTNRERRAARARVSWLT